jgi:GGDEF domain-containing protein
LAEQEVTMAKAYERMVVIKDKLEARLANQVRIGINLLQAAKALEKQETGEVLFGVIEIVGALMSPEKFSLYLMRNGLLGLTIQKGWSSTDHYQREFAPNTWLFQEIVERQKALCCANEEDKPILGGEGVLAGPLVSPENHDVLGMLKVEKLGFLDLHFIDIQTFKALCQWVATAYVDAQRYQTARSEGDLGTDTRLLSYSFLVRQTSFLGELAKRVGFDLCMIILSLENAEQLTQEEMSVIPQALAGAVTKVLRKSDLAFDYQRTGWEFAIVLPGTSIENAQIVADKLMGNLKANLHGKAKRAQFSLKTQEIYKDRNHSLDRHALLSHDHFPRQTAALANLARRMDFDLSMIVIQLVNAGGLSEEQRRMVPGAVNSAIRKLLPHDTPAFAYQRSGLEFAVILPDIPIPESQGIADALLSELSVWIEGQSGEACFSLAVQLVHAGHRKETLDVIEV